MPRLDTPKIDYMPSYIAALREGHYLGLQKPKTGDEIQAIENDPETFLKDYLAVKTTPLRYNDGTSYPRMPRNDFWFVDGKTFLGEIGIRHSLNEKLFQTGGHIVYSIRPSARDRGHATELLRQSLDFCHDILRLERVLLTAREDNISSIKVIEKNGGVLENTVISHFDGKLSRRYWINL